MSRNSWDMSGTFAGVFRQHVRQASLFMIMLMCFVVITDRYLTWYDLMLGMFSTLKRGLAELVAWPRPHIITCHFQDEVAHN